MDDNEPGADASAPCDVGAGSFTVEFWVRGLLVDNGTPNAGGDVESYGVNWIDGNIIIDRDIWGDSAADWGISFAGGFTRFGTGSGDGGDDPESTIEGNVNVLDGSWHHVACVRDAASGRKRIYVDVEEDFSTVNLFSDDDISYPDDGVTNPVTPWNPYIVVGAEKHDADPVTYPSFTGYVDELRIWTSARTPLELEATFNRIIPGDTAGLVAYYRFEEGAGSWASDTSAAGSPVGEVIAGKPGNGEWVARSDDPNNTAPLLMDASVPTVSTLGLAVTAFVALILGMLVFARRRGAS